MAVALFCFEQARQSVSLAEWSDDLGDFWHGLSEFDRVELYVLKLDHVYKAACELDGQWPGVFPSCVQAIASRFIELWETDPAGQVCEACASGERCDGPNRQAQSACESCKGGKHQCRMCQAVVCDLHARYRHGKELRNAFSHYSEILADAGHRLRGRPSDSRTVRGIETPSWMRMHTWDTEGGPSTLSLMGKSYRLHKIY